MAPVASTQQEGQASGGQPEGEAQGTGRPDNLEEYHLDEAMRQSMFFWHELGHFPAFSGFSLSSAQSESSPHICVDIES